MIYVVSMSIGLPILRKVLQEHAIMEMRIGMINRLKVGTTMHMQLPCVFAWRKMVQVGYLLPHVMWIKIHIYGMWIPLI